MQISGRFSACLTVQEPGELFAVAEEKLDLEAQGVSVDKFMTIQLWISRAQNDETRLGRVFLVEEDHHAPAPLKRLVPHHGGIQMPMRCLCPGSEVLETAQDLEVHLPIICAPGPTSLRVWTGVKKPAVGVAPPCGDGMQIEADDFIQIFLLRIVAIHAMRGDARRQAMSLLTQLRRVEVNPGGFRLGLRGVLA